MRYLLAISLSLFLFCSCGSSAFYEKIETIENQSWSYEDRKTFEIEIEDTDAQYDLAVLVRHSTDFPSSNLWVKVRTEFPDGTSDEKPVNLPLAEDSGKWYGSGIAGNLNLTVPIQQNASMPEKGVYRFTVSQNMRTNPLLEVAAIGIQVQKK